MSTDLRTIAALFTALALSAAPASAQRRHDGGSGRATTNDGGTRAEPRQRGTPRSDGGEQRQAQPRREPRVEGRRGGGSPGNGGGNPGNGVNRGNLRSDGPRNDVSGNGRDDRRAVPRYDGRQNDHRDGRYVAPYREVRPRVVTPQYRYRSYPYRAYPYRSYVVPYGYRPYGYRPGWSLNLYFGRPYVGGFYTDRSYGYYSLAPGFAYGSLRIVDAPHDARVYVDGYYAGVVDDYDGVFQHLNLEPGAHHIEIEIDPGVEPIAFDVYIQPGQTVTYHLSDRY
jgi:hypothetical protein